MRAKRDGFELVFTSPVDPASAGRVESYALKTYTYIFQSNYGSPEVDPTTPTVTRADVSADGLRVRLTVEGLRIGHVHELAMAGVRARSGTQPLLHPIGYYTLWRLPDR